MMMYMRMLLRPLSIVSVIPWRISPFLAAGVESMAANQVIFWPFVLATDNLS